MLGAGKTKTWILVFVKFAYSWVDGNVANKTIWGFLLRRSGVPERLVGEVVRIGSSSQVRDQ